MENFAVKRNFYFVWSFWIYNILKHLDLDIIAPFIGDVSK